MSTLFEEYELKNSIRNKLDCSDRQFHDWYRFVLSYPPHLVRKYLNEFNVTKDDLILDPFCGTGTTLVEAKLLGIPSLGIEANPFAHFASSVKLNWEIDEQELLNVAYSIKLQANDELLKQKIFDLPTQENLKANKLKEFPADKLKLILKDSLSPLPTHKCITLLDIISEFKGGEFYKFFALALAKSAVFQFSNLRFGPEVGVGKKKIDAPVISLWYNEVVKIANDIKRIKPQQNGTFSKVILSDARNLSDQISNYKIAAVITSPPYPNEKDYTRTTRLESVLLGFISSSDELKKFKKTLLRSNSRGVYKGDDDDQYVKAFPEIQRIADEIENRRIELGKTSGFERLYHKVTKLYFGGIAKHLIELQGVLKPNAHLAYVVGDQASYLRVMIRTGHLIAEIAQSLGYEVVKIDLFRTRFSTATKSDLNEEVVVLRWKG